MFGAVRVQHIDFDAMDRGTLIACRPGATVPAVPNAYCDRLGLEPPRLLDVALGNWENHLDLLVLTLLARGEPMAMDEIVGALSSLWSGSPGSLRILLQKAWGGRRPIVKDADGRLALDLDCPQMRRVLVRLGLRAPPPPPPVPPEYIPLAPDVPLTIQELKACFGRGCPSGISGMRLAAAVLDVMNRPMLPVEILGIVQAWTAERMPKPELSRYGPKRSLVVSSGDGRVSLDRTRTADLHAMRTRVRELGLPRLRQSALIAWDRKQAEARRLDDSIRLAALRPVPAVVDTKVPWNGRIVSVQPRIRMTRSFDQCSHSYLGYVLRVRGVRAAESSEFVVAIGKAAQETHQFRVGDEVSGDGVRVDAPQRETADLFKASGLKVVARGPSERTASPPFTGIPPALEEYRSRGHRRLAALTYASKCVSCFWSCEIAVEMIIDPWKPSNRRHRREAFCYGPKNCQVYAAGPARTVPGRNGTLWTEEDWVDEEATRQRGIDD